MQGKENRKYIEKDYRKVLALRRRGLSQDKIAKEVGLSSTTVWYWINTSRKPRFLYAKRLEKSFPKRAMKLSPKLAYIYGVLIGDASIERRKRTWRITLNVTNKNFALTFANTLEKWCGLKPTIKQRIQKHDHITKYGSPIKCTSHLYVVRLSSKQTINFLLNKIKCKTYNWEVPKDILNCYKKTDNL